MKDITGQRFGILTAVKPTSNRQYGSIIWEFRCDCGRTKYASLRNITSNHKAHSCGCLRRTNERLEIVGNVYGKLTVERVYYDEDMKKVMCLCRCTCGNEKKTCPSTLLRSGLKSCGHACERRTV